MTKTLGSVGAALLVLGVGTGGCGRGDEPSNGGEQEHPDAVVVDFYKGAGLASACSGTLVAPNVVLTAAHCAEQSDGARVTAPQAMGQKAEVKQVLVYNWSTDPQHHTQEHDVALLVLRTPIQSSRYATISSDSCEGCDVVAYGRTHDADGYVHADVALSEPMRLASGWQPGRPSMLFSARGAKDAGGAIRRSSEPNGPIVGVASSRGASTGGGYFVRLDLPEIQTWLDTVITSSKADLTAPPSESKPQFKLGVSIQRTDDGSKPSGDSGEQKPNEDQEKTTVGLERTDQNPPPNPYDAKPKMKTGSSRPQEVSSPDGKNYWTSGPKDDAALRNTQTFADKHPDANVIASHGNPGSMEGRPPNDKVSEMAQNGKPVIAATCYGNARVPGLYVGTSDETDQWNSNASQIADDAGISRDQVYACQGEVGTDSSGGSLGCDGKWQTANGRDLTDAERKSSNLDNCNVRRRDSNGDWAGGWFGTSAGQGWSCN